MPRHCAPPLVARKHQSFHSFTIFNKIHLAKLPKVAQEICKAISYLIESDEIKREHFESIGLAVVSGSSEGFIRGTVAAAITASCKAGLLGESLKSVNPTIIGAITVITMNVIKNSIEIACGKKTRSQLVEKLVRDTYVSSCGLALGTVTAAMLSEILLIAPFGFLIGNFVGSIVGSFTYGIGRKTVISFCIDSGFTMFGLVEQDYVLPDEIIKEISIETFKYESFDTESLNRNRFLLIPSIQIPLSLSPLVYPIFAEVLSESIILVMNSKCNLAIMEYKDLFGK